jgi:hypothetical protein
MEQKENHKDTHGSSGMTRWVHRHRRLAKWLLKFLVAGVAAFLYYLRSQEKIIEQESKDVHK